LPQAAIDQILDAEFPASLCWAHGAD